MASNEIGVKIDPMGLTLQEYTDGLRLSKHPDAMTTRKWLARASKKSLGSFRNATDDEVFLAAVKVLQAATTMLKAATDGISDDGPAV